MMGLLRVEGWGVVDQYDNGCWHRRRERELCLDGVNICCIADEMHVSEFSSSTLRRWRCGVST